MTAECRERFMAFIREAIMVREFQVIDARIADERARNICQGVEAEFFVTCREDPWNGGNESSEGSPSPGSGSSGPVGSASRSTATAGMTGSGSRVAGAASTTQSETMAQHADRVIT